MNEELGKALVASLNQTAQGLLHDVPFNVQDKLGRAMTEEEGEVVQALAVELMVHYNRVVAKVQKKIKPAEPNL